MKASLIIRNMMLFSIPFISFIIGLNLYFIDVHADNRHLLGIVSLGALVYINVVVFVILNVLEHESEKINQYKNANAQLELQQKHYKEMLEKNHEVRGLWHDMNNHLITLEYLIKNHASDEIENYLRQFHELLQNSADLNRSGNHVVDALLNYKIKVAADHQINFVHYIAIPEKLKINSIDLSIILGNLLDNAIEGCMRDCRRNQEKIIKFNMYYKRESLLIDIENTVDEKTIQKSGNNIVSSKRNDADHYGYGISNVKQVLKSYQGNMVYQILDDRFKCTILIPLD